MSPAAGVSSDRVPMMMPTSVQSGPGVISEAFAKDAIIAWFRGEFAAANAIIDALCNHLTQLDGGRGEEYEAVFGAIHRRRLNWIQILQMQKYCSISDVALELRKVTEKKVNQTDESIDVTKVISQNEKHDNNQNVSEEKPMEIVENGGAEPAEVIDEQFSTDDSPKSGITDSGSQEAQQMLENMVLCSNHEECEARRADIKLTKGFVAKEPVKGHTVNVVRGLKMYDDVFTETELAKLTDFVGQLRVAGQNGELSGDTFIMYNQQQTKKNKRELIQLGAPIFGHIKEDASNQTEPIPPLLQGVVDHLVQWNLISENRKPNSCIINFFDEGEYSQPFQKPPHLEQPISTLLLSESTMAFGRSLVCDNDGNYKGPLMLSLNQGSLLVMRGNSADMARHVMCPAPNKRVSITFFKVRSETIETNSPASAIPPLTSAMTLWQPGIPTPYGYEGINVMPKWGMIRSPLVMLAPMRPMVVSPKSMPGGVGTGVFLPWTGGSRKPARHLPPRAQRGKILALPSPIEPTTDTSIATV